MASAAVVAAAMIATQPIAARPQYGGTLRIEASGLLRTWDPAVLPSDPADAAARAPVLPLIFETLIRADDGGLKPQLAVAWQRDANSPRWRLRLRGGVTLHDGSLLQPAMIAASLRSSSGWQVATDGDTLIVENDADDLPWQLADNRHAIVIRRGSGTLIGTGPFRIDRVEMPRAGEAAVSHVTLRAHEDYWGGRPFVDAVDIEFGLSNADRLAALDAGRADMAAIAPPDAARAAQHGAKVVGSRPVSFVALAFEEHRAMAAAAPLREAVAASIDRSTLCAVLLQKWAEPAGGVLPDWLSGYAALFSMPTRSAARTLVAALPVAQRSLALRVDSASPIDRAIADRIAVDARDAGLTVRVDAADGLAPRPDLRLVHVPLQATSADRALTNALGALGPRTMRVLPADLTLAPGAPLPAVYRLERDVLAQRVLVPVIHVRDVYAVSDRAQSWTGPVILPSGLWDLGNVWIRTDKP